MRLESLRVIHFLKAEGSLHPFGRPELGASFYLNSCQRMIWVDFGDEEISEAGFETFFGCDAYGFLLKVAVAWKAKLRARPIFLARLKILGKSSPRPIHCFLRFFKNFSKTQKRFALTTCKILADLLTEALSVNFCVKKARLKARHS
jgi:hypothetical protein